MSGKQREFIELYGRQICDYQLADLGQHPLGRINEFLRPILLDPQSYVVERDARLVTSNLVGVNQQRQIVEETLHLKELDRRSRRDLRLRALLPPQERIQGTVCSLVDIRQWSGSYYHWFLDCLPRLLAVEHHDLGQAKPTRVIVPAKLSPWQRESLHLLSISPERQISHRPVGRGGLRVERLLAMVSHRWQRMGDAPFDAASPWAIQLLADRLNQRIETPTIAPPQRLYLSRRGVPTRRVINEDELLAMLAPHGFVRVQSEQLSLQEQITMFRGATHIIAPHGASLTNLIHARNCSVLELFQENHGVRPDFFQLAMINCLNYHHSVCPTCGPTMDCRIPPQVVKDFLDHTL